MQLFESLIQDLNEFLEENKKYEITFVIYFPHKKPEDAIICQIVNEKKGVPFFSKNEVLNLFETDIKAFTEKYPQYKNYLLSKGISPNIVFSKNEPYPESAICYTKIQNGFIIILSYAVYNEIIDDYDVINFYYLIGEHRKLKTLKEVKLWRKEKS